MTNVKNPVWKMVPILMFSFLFVLNQGCDSTEPDGSRISLSFSTPAVTDKITDDTLVLDTVKILLRDIKLGFEKDPNNWGSSTGDDQEINVKVGPFVVYLNLAGVATNFAVSTIPEGTYNKIKFKIHQVEPNEPPIDPEFKEGDNNSLRYSVIVKGIFNSQSFIYKSRKPAHQKLMLDTPIVVEPNTITDLTITVDPSTWFMKDGVYLDPNDPANENDIDNNIKDSFKRCYKDDNYDSGNN
jgi:hypothetical protein